MKVINNEIHYNVVMTARIIILIILIVQLPRAQSTLFNLCNLDTTLLNNHRDSVIIRFLYDNPLGENDCVELRQRLNTVNWSNDSLKIMNSLEDLELAGKLYSCKEAGIGSEYAYHQMLDRMKREEYVTAFKFAIIAGYLRKHFILTQQRWFSSSLAAIREAISHNEFQIASSLIDTTEKRSAMTQRGILYKDSLSDIKRLYSIQKNKMELANRLYNQVEKSNTTYSVAITFGVLFIPEVSGINWTVNTVLPNSQLYLNGTRIPSKIILPIGIRVGRFLSENVAVEFESSFSQDVQDIIQFGSIALPAGYRRTIVSGKLDGKYLFRTNFGLRPYLSLGFAVLHLTRTGFHPPRKIFDPFFTGYNMQPPKDYIIDAGSQIASEICFELGGNVLLPTAGGRFVDFFIGVHTAKGSFTYSNSYTCMLGVRIGMMW